MAISSTTEGGKNGFAPATFQSNLCIVFVIHKTYHIFFCTYICCNHPHLEAINISGSCPRAFVKGKSNKKVPSEPSERVPELKFEYHVRTIRLSITCFITYDRFNIRAGFQMKRSLFQSNVTPSSFERIKSYYI